MNRTFVRAATLACTLLATSAIVSPALAQLQSTIPLPPRSTVDGNGVNLGTGHVSIPKAAVSIGGPGNSLAYTLQLQEGQEYGSMFGWLTNSGSTTTVTLGTTSEQFTLSGGVYTPVEARGSSFDGSHYTRADGTTAVYGVVNGTVSLIWVTKPNGEKLTYNYGGGAIVTGGTPTTYTRLASIQSSNGYMLLMGYQSNDLQNDGPTLWKTLTSVKAVNMAVETCTTTSCTSGASWPNLSMSWDSTNRAWSYTDSLSRVSRFAYDSSSRITGVRYPGSSSDNISYSYDTNGRVSSATKAGITTSYAYSDSGNTRTTTVTFPGGATRILTFDIAKAVPLTDQDELSHTTTYHYDSSARLDQVTAPEGNYVQYTYDTRGNVTGTLAHAKSGSGLSDITTSAVFPSSCTNVLTCNKPSSSTDARGNTTSYSWDGTHGGLLSVTAPAIGGVSPETRYGYTALQAYYKDSSGSIVASGQNTYELTSTSQCQTGASCSATSDEAKVTISYGSTGVANNLLPTSVSTGAGDGSLTATVTTTWDNVGNVSSVDEPLSGTADTVMYRYDADREPIGTVSADPDGAGSLHNRATRTTYDGHGLVTRVEQGTVNSYSDTDWSGFSSLQQVDTGYDSNLRPVTQSVASGGTTYALTQTSYDGLGRVQCVAQRMYPTYFGSLPSDACTLGTSGSYGPDRIAKTSYDAAGHVNLVQSAYGVTGVQSDDVATTYTNNGLVSTVTDAESNKTTYGYDGFDRPVATFYPDTTKGAGTSNMSSGYELLTLDANGNATSRRLRDGNSIGYTYDALNRVTAKDLPGTEPDVAYAYDNLGRMTGSTFTGTSNGVAIAYDALSRLLSRTVTMGGVSRGVSYQYDAASRRTRMDYPDSFYITYDYLVTGEMAHIYEGGTSATLATYAYDDLGRRTSLTRGNGVVTSYGYDAVSRLTSLSHNPSGTAQDVTFSFGYDPAGGIASRTTSNDSYAYTGMGNGNVSYAANGLNQNAVTGTTFSWDTKGNLTSDGSNSYVYSSENRLASMTNPGTWSTATSLTYDSLGGLQQVNSNYSGFWAELFEDEAGQVVKEYATLSRARRYVFGPGSDEVLVQYFTSPSSNFRTWYYQDERNSVVATGDDTGSASGLNRYESYGMGQSTNSGRFQYTGQFALFEPGIFYYKNRFYDPKLGTFLQTDPAGYADGMNWYAYVRGNPVNSRDTTGLGIFDAVSCTDVWVPNSYGSVIVDQGSTSTGDTGGNNASSDDEAVITGQRMPTGHYEQKCFTIPGVMGAAIPIFNPGDGFGLGGGGGGHSTPSPAEHPLPPVVCSGSRTIICNRPFTQEERCQGAKDTRDLGDGILYATTIGGGALAIAGKSSGAGLGIALLIGGFLGGSGLILEKIECN
jgi:RHS repeat-associated protein